MHVERLTRLFHSHQSHLDSFFKLAGLFQLKRGKDQTRVACIAQPSQARSASILSRLSRKHKSLAIASYYHSLLGLAAARGLGHLPRWDALCSPHSIRNPARGSARPCRDTHAPPSSGSSTILGGWFEVCSSWGGVANSIEFGIVQDRTFDRAKVRKCELEGRRVLGLAERRPPRGVSSSQPHSREQRRDRLKDPGG